MKKLSLFKDNGSGARLGCDEQTKAMIMHSEV